MDTDDLDQELSKESDEESEAKGDSRRRRRRGRVMMREKFTELALIKYDWSASSSSENCSLTQTANLFYHAAIQSSDEIISLLIGEAATVQSSLGIWNSYSDPFLIFTSTYLSRCTSTYCLTRITSLTRL